MMTDKNIKKWYRKIYPTDSLGKQIDEDLSFVGLYQAMSERKEVYEVLGVVDSIIRERVFGELAKMRKVPYDTIYHLWLYGN